MAQLQQRMVKELRESTGAGMMECKKALTETDGDMEAAVDVLRKSGALRLRRRQEELRQKVLLELHLKAIQQL